MKNILKVALVAMISTCNADPSSDRTIKTLTNDINYYRKVVESNITEALYKSTKEIDMDGIKANAKSKDLKNVKLEGLILYGVPVPTTESDAHSVDFLISMHEGSLNYNIVHAKSYDGEVTSPSLAGYVKDQVPSEGYFVLTDDLKNNISENGSANSAYKPDFGITPLRAEAFKSALSNPTVQFDKAKFLKENQLTDPKLQDTTSSTLEQIKTVTKLKQDTDHLHFDLNKALISDTSLLEDLDGLIDSFVQNIEQYTRPDYEKTLKYIKGILIREIDENLQIKDNNILKLAFLESADIFLQYSKSRTSNSNSDYSIDLLKTKCKNQISDTLASFTVMGNTHLNSDQKKLLMSAIRSINEKMEEIHKGMLNAKDTTHNSQYNANQITTALSEVKSIINSLSGTVDIGSMTQLLNKYESEKLKAFDFADEIGNEIYLNESFYAIDSIDKITQLRLLQLSRHNKIASDIFNYDMVFPKQGISGSENKSTFISLLKNAMQSNKFFGMYLYNSQIGTNEIKDPLKSRTDSIKLFDFLNENKSNLLFNDTLKDILKDSRTTQNAINKLTEEDYTQLYSAIYVKSDHEHMKKFANLQDYLRDVQTQQP